MPHLDEKTKQELWASIPPYQRESRSKGIPQLGAGAIYPIAQEEIMVEPFKIPAWWPRVYGMDVGWNWTACVWMAWDQQNDIAYIYNEYKRGQAEPAVHAAAIRSRGSWMWGVIDPAARHRSQVDGAKLVELYSDPVLGLNLGFAENAVDAGIGAVFDRLSTGRMKIFNNLNGWFAEYRTYHRDEKGKIVKLNDHLMDATRYLIISGFSYVSTEPFPEDYYSTNNSIQSRSSVTGY